MAVLFKHACLLASVGATNAAALFWGHIRASARWSTHVWNSHSHLPFCQEWALSSSGTAGLGRSRGGGGGSWVEKGGVTSALGGGSPPAVPIWGEKRPRGSSISYRDGPEWPMAAAEQKRSLSSSISHPPHSITSLGKRSRDNEHSLLSTDLHFTQVSSCSQWNKL